MSMMKRKEYSIFVSQDGKVEAVKTGWSWPAFCFGSIWALCKGMWVIGVLIWIAPSILGLLSMVVVSEQLIGSLFLVLIFGFPFIFGFWGNDWRKRNLLSRGYQFKMTIRSFEPFQAEEQFRNT